MIIRNNGKYSMTYWIVGDGVIMEENCLNLLKWASENPSKKANLTTISNDTGIPRMSLRWILVDAKVRERESKLYRTARIYNYKYRIDSAWNMENKYKRTKHIIRAKKV
jgi:hypothetical protein